jgi:ABC-type multidrug transport system ATPase subunit
LRLDGRADIGSRVESVLDELGLATRADTLIRSLSGGERRRAACGLELVGDPPALLLDEPTSGLDEVLERRLMQLFRRLARQGRAVLVATHATTSLELCDEVIVLQEGQTAYRGDWSGARAHVTAVAEEATDAPATAIRSPAAPAAPVTVRRPFRRELRAIAGRYLRTMVRDRRTLAVLVLQAPVIGLLIAVVFQSGALAAGASPIGVVELVFLVMTGAIWLGVASAAREVV